MERYLRNAVIYAILGVFLLIIGVVWMIKATGTTGLSMFSCGVCFELVALVYYIKHKKEE